MTPLLQGRKCLDNKLVMQTMITIDNLITLSVWMMMLVGDDQPDATMMNKRGEVIVVLKK
jgi:hypothetical protein